MRGTPLVLVAHFQSCSYAHVFIPIVDVIHARIHNHLSLTPLLYTHSLTTHNIARRTRIYPATRRTYSSPFDVSLLSSPVPIISVTQPVRQTPPSPAALTRTRSPTQRRRRSSLRPSFGPSSSPRCRTASRAARSASTSAMVRRIVARAFAAAADHSRVGCHRAASTRTSFAVMSSLPTSTIR